VIIIEIISRMMAVFIVAALGTLGAGSLLGLETAVSISMAGLLAVAKVTEDLAREYLRDGKITRKEINNAFSKFADSVGDSHDHEHPVPDDRCPSRGSVKRKPKKKQEEILIERK